MGREIFIYYNKKELERIRKQGEKDYKKMNMQTKEFRYKSGSGNPIVCVMCKYDYFIKGKSLLNTRGLTFFDLDWLNQSATTLMCTRCGYIHWFGKEIVKVE